MTRRILIAGVDGWPAVRSDVMRRDRACVFAPLPPMQRGDRPLGGVLEHFCRDRYDRPIEWWHTTPDRADVELDHVKEDLMLGQKAPDDSAHLVVVCHGAHHRGLATSHDGREYERAWLAAYYPGVWAAFLERQR